MKVAFIIFCVILSVQSKVQWSDWESRTIAENKNWKLSSNVDGEQVIDFTIGLQLRNSEIFTPLLLSLSDPTSPKYGEYLSKQEVYQLSSPQRKNIELVKNWLVNGNALQVKEQNNGGFLYVTMKVSHAIRLFSGDSPIQFHSYSHAYNPSRVEIRTTEAVFIPEEIFSLIQVIDGLNNFPYLKFKKEKTEAVSSLSYSIIPGDSVANINVRVNGSRFSMVSVTLGQEGDIQVRNSSVANSPLQFVSFVFKYLANYVYLDVTVTAIDRQTGELVTAQDPYFFDVFPSPWVTPAVANSLYFIPPGTRSTNPGNSQAVAEFDGQFYSPSDLSQFSSLMGLPEPIVTVYGTNNASAPGGESTLDIEWITAIGVEVPTVFWYVERGFLLTWAISVSEADIPPLVHSISYGEPEAFVRPSLAERLNQEFKLLGMRGLTIVSTSGDLGSSDGTKDCRKDVPDFPSSSPWTTSLGATFIARVTETPICKNNEVYSMPIYCDTTAELPCAVDAGTGFTTGGGFSAKFGRPSYQDQAVSEYLNTAPLPPASYFNQSGRGYNDVGALGYNILTVQNGEIQITGGTSASGPIFAGVIALLNDIQLNQGKAPLGFVNPWLYQTAATNQNVFNQVLSGDNSCRESSQQCCDNGFVAQSGWNPLTGLGTPVYSLLTSYLP